MRRLALTFFVAAVLAPGAQAAGPAFGVRAVGKWKHGYFVYAAKRGATLSGKVDFRCVRFPGLISAMTVPSGGTSDYAPEMIHAAARGDSYPCFVRPDTRIPFMAMPDGVEALLRLARAPTASLTRTAYNVTAFSPSAEQIRDIVARDFPQAAISGSWTPGRPTWTTAPRGETGDSCRSTTSSAGSPST